VLAGPGSIRVAHTAQEQLSLADLLAGADLNHRLALHFLQE
jgi:acetylornithine deacetylase/succinyl-diaminopimelate desuccinylase-like protein